MMQNDCMGNTNVCLFVISLYLGKLTKNFQHNERTATGNFFTEKRSIVLEVIITIIILTTMIIIMIIIMIITHIVSK